MGTSKDAEERNGFVAAGQMILYVFVVKIIAHRGNSIAYPENTMAAFRSAWATGAGGIELDVRMSADGMLVVFHDEDGVRLAGRRERVETSPWPVIRTWRVGGEPVPLLEEVLAEAPAGSTVLIELKGGRILLPTLNRIVSSANGLDLHLLAFDPLVAADACALGWPVWLNVEASHVGTICHRIDRIANAGLAGVSLAWCRALTTSLVQTIHDAGLSCAVWTVNHPADALAAQAMGVDILMTDHPAGIAKEVEKHGT